ncbi:MAG: methylmalonyl-CoA mutase family protein [Gammaproteobacteria bacterium]
MSPAAALETRTEPVPSKPVRFVTATSLFDGHDAAINLIRRLLLAQGAEVVHLGHNRSVAELVQTALSEDAQAIAVSSYQGGHMEYFKYLVDELAREHASDIAVIVGGGGTIAPDEVKELEAYGVERIYRPEDGQRLGLEGMIDDILQRVRKRQQPPVIPQPGSTRDRRVLARTISWIESHPDSAMRTPFLRSLKPVSSPASVIGLTGSGGAGKSSLTDELVRRFLEAFPALEIAVVAVDPTRNRTGGALLGDRIRMNSLAHPRVFMRSLATGRQGGSLHVHLGEIIQFLKAQGFGLVLVETAGSGQGDTAISDLVDLSLYVMTSDYGGPLQLEKLGMLDYADLIVLNKFEKRGSDDALRDIRKQWRRNHAEFKRSDEDVPVFATIASQFQNSGVDRLFAELCRMLKDRSGDDPARWKPAQDLNRDPPAGHVLIPQSHERYLAEIAQVIRNARERNRLSAEAASRAQSLHDALGCLDHEPRPEPLERYPAEALVGDNDRVRLRQAYEAALDAVGQEGIASLKDWPARLQSARAEAYAYPVRDQWVKGANYTETLSGLRVPKIALPNWRDWGDILSFIQSENLPGAYPYTAGVYPYRRTAEDPTRMFAGEGTPERTNRRFHYLARGQNATRLSTAFDSVTLYGEDPDHRPDIYGRIGNSGVSIATLDDMKKLYSGFDLLSPNTSVSMTINGPAPILLALFFNAAIDQAVERHLIESGGFESARADLRARLGEAAPHYTGALPEGHSGLGLGFLGISGDRLVGPETYARIRTDVLKRVRGTVQADILKEDQAQNTCIFSVEFALKLMGDVAAYFVEHDIRNFYSVSVSGYHIAEAGANPITQLAFTLANGFTLVEYYLARGLSIDAFAPNLSFFFSNGMDSEYAVIGRVARRIWARALRERYGASSRSQMLKYHIQTSGRSLHAREIQFNDIRTTLQALYAIYDNCQSLHTNAYDEALTTPTEESVRRAMAIQLIINRELGLAKNENPLQGAFIIETLTDLVEEAVLVEFDRISERGGVLGAMETMYQRNKIQEESLLYERLKHDGRLPIVGVNCFLPENASAEPEAPPALIRSTEEEKREQLDGLHLFQALHRDERPQALSSLREAARRGDNLFSVLMDAVRVCSLGEITRELYGQGGKYRRAI